MNSERLYEAITDLPEELPEEAAAYTFNNNKRKRPYRRWAAAAAAVVLLPLAVLAARYSGGLGSWGSGGNAGYDGYEAAEEVGGSQASRDLVSVTYQSCAGPVLPLATLGGAEELTAERRVTLDCTPYIWQYERYEDESGSGWLYRLYDSELTLRDEYVLTNPTEEDVTVTAAYPFAAAFSDPLRCLPAVSVDGEEAETSLFAGGDGGTLDGWEAYRALLADGSYREEALSAAAALDLPVTVYEFSDITAPANDAPNPTLSVRMTLDYARSTVLSLGFNGGQTDQDHGVMVRECSVPEAQETGREESRYLIVLGDDVTDMTLRGCRSGGSWNSDSEDLPGVAASVRRYASTLQAELQKLTDELYDGKMLWRSGGEVRLLAEVPGEVFLDALTETLRGGGLLSDDPAERSRCEWLEDAVSRVWNGKRVLYLTFPVTVPAHGSVTVTAEMAKIASRDYEDETGTDSYELAVRLGSDLRFRSQTVSLLEAEQVEILEQSFAFDPEGSTEQTLDGAWEYGYLRLRRRDV